MFLNLPSWVYHFSICRKTESLEILGNRLSYLHIQDALLLLRHFLAIPKVTVHSLNSSMFPVWEAAEVRWIAQDHHQQHHKKLPAQLNPSVDPGLSPCETRRTGYHECSSACSLYISCICCWIISPGIPNPPKSPTGGPTCCQRSSTPVLVSGAW